MHIAVEGPESIRKSESARLLAQALGGLYVDMPLQYLLGGRNAYTRLADKLEMQPSKDLRAWFYGFSSLYFSDYLTERTVITDQYFPSNWAANCTPDNLPAFDALASGLRVPEHTFLLTGTAEDGSKPSDEDLYIQCLERYGFPYTVVDCRELNAHGITSEMLRVLQENELITGRLY